MWANVLCSERALNFSTSAFLNFEHQGQIWKLRTYFSWCRASSSQICQCLLLTRDAIVAFNHGSIINSGDAQTYWLGNTRTNVSSVSIFAFSGGAALGHVANVFNNLDMASPHRVVQVLPMELTNWDSYISMPSMCVGGFGHWFIDNTHLVENSIWLGVSFGAFAASESALLCEAALAHVCAVVGVEPRT